MSFLKRITATITANLDRAISQMENHDAVAEVAIDEIRDATARLKVQFGRVRAETQRLERSIVTLDQEEQKWTGRAKRTAAEDEQRALACLERRATCREKRDLLRSKLAKNRELEQRLGRDLERLDARLDDINARRQEFRSRELSVRGIQAAAELERDGKLDVDRLFERWEVEITRSEIGVEHDTDSADELADDFDRAERSAELREELNELLDNREEENRS